MFSVTVGWARFARHVVWDSKANPRSVGIATAQLRRKRAANSAQSIRVRLDTENKAKIGLPNLTVI
jgi:hypothetical protein